ncbi:hypothetical protein [Streptomyces lavendulae]|uniref:hypothetical protein n=1 Tax=Streptomyces lavendulae TaxID=1914 RepID=UPI00249FB3EA|nr:hypothetical protein [Streptomyces lavendulae]GLX19034.1 hypothetical protein Slala01_26780 [Streptomyces lavendulae subsp. lavendulae]GLX31199.1 hypothetical protein Slala02_70180 [Streptomyces lavendulae subsp. lavendulae]
MENEIQESGTPEIPPVDPAIPDATVPTRAPRRRGRGRGRTTLLIAAALVLGAVAGTVTGYAVQYHRPPTALPPLAQQKLDTPKALAPDNATTAKSINANRWHKTDGDLTELLIEAPAGAKVEAEGYDTLDSFATTFEKPDFALRSDVKDGFRRLATRVWTQGDVLVEVRLVQYRDFAGADEYQKSQASYMPGKGSAGNDGVAVPGVPAELGHVWIDSEAHAEPGYMPVRQGRAIVRRGDIVLDVFYFDKRGRAISEGDVLDLAKRQLERL